MTEQAINPVITEIDKAEPPGTNYVHTHEGDVMTSAWKVNVWSKVVTWKMDKAPLPSMSN